VVGYSYGEGVGFYLSRVKRINSEVAETNYRRMEKTQFLSDLLLASSFGFSESHYQENKNIYLFHKSRNM
jgi:hypothetical protein